MRCVAPARSKPSFVGRWVARLLYYDFPEWMFAAAYTVFALAVALAWRLVPPMPAGALTTRQRRPIPGDRRYHSRAAPLPDHAAIADTAMTPHPSSNTST